MMRTNFAIVILGIFLSAQAFSKAQNSQVGKKAAQKYFKKRQSSNEVRERKSKVVLNKNTHFLGLHIGGFYNDKSYKWGGDTQEGVGQYTLGLSYRVGEWVNSTDFLVRVDFNSFKVHDEKATKMSFMPMVSFPDARSGFPLYFGAATGLGIYFKQLEGESSMSLDYQIFAGARLFNVLDTIGLSFETGLKNHLHLLSDGQFNSTYIQAGTVFVF